MPLSKARHREDSRRRRADLKATAQKILALSLPARSHVLPVEERKQILSQLAQLPPDRPDPIRAIAELNRMEGVGTPAKGTGGDTYNQVILQGFTIDELRTIVTRLKDNPAMELSRP